MNTYGRKVEVFCQRDVFGCEIDFWLRQKSWTPDRMTVAIAEPLVFRELTDRDSEGIETPRAFRLTTEAAQQFMDELWRVGLRPTEGTGSAGALAAVEKHLADMRALVFKKEPKGF